MTERPSLAGLNCLVTGASRGIGRATAIALTSRGARVWALARSLDALLELERECGASPLVEIQAGPHSDALQELEAGSVLSPEVEDAVRDHGGQAELPTELTGGLVQLGLIREPGVLELEEETVSP